MRALEKFEASQPPMSAYFPDLVRSIDVPAEFSRLKTVAFPPASNGQGNQGASAVAGSGAKPRGDLAPDLAATLDDGDRRIAAKDGPGAASAFERVLERVPGQPRALYGLAVASILQGDGGRARDLFEQVVGSSAAPDGPAADPVALAWSHIYLGRMNDLDGNRDLALGEYRAALAVAGAPEAARVAAQRGIEQVYQPEGQPEGHDPSPG